jgi:hypothetical protein
MFRLTRNRGAWGHLLEWRDRADKLVAAREIVETRTWSQENTLIWWGFSGCVCRIDWRTNSALKAGTSIRIGSRFLASQRWEFPFWPTRVHNDAWCVHGRRAVFEVTKRTIACLGLQVSYRSQSRLLAASVLTSSGSRFVVARRLSLKRVDLICAIIIVQSLPDRMYSDN